MRKHQSIKAFEAEWYQRLKDDGFEDIEETKIPGRPLKLCHSSYFVSKYHQTSFEGRQEYYRRAGIFLEHHKFQTKMDREIWARHAAGESVREIANALSETAGAPKKSWVQKIIQRLARKMLITEE